MARQADLGKSESINEMLGRQLQSGNTGECEDMHALIPREHVRSFFVDHGVADCLEHVSLSRPISHDEENSCLWITATRVCRGNAPVLCGGV